ncbi:hypothetical protein K438DRAFT_1820323 [Mycena galopus ATCC 62051]|nr:hypothetical protein K438DRAFT_1820323 [Mycena galopus ATCC 62051]
MCIEVAGGVNAVGTPLQIALCAPTTARQQFVRVTPSSGTSAFALQWGSTDKCIDLTGGSIVDDTPLLLATCVDGDTNQEFTDSSGTITIQPAAAVNEPEPFCMGATSATPGALVMLLSCPAFGFADPSALLTWTIPSPFTGVSTEPMAIATSFDLCLNVAGGVDADGTTLELATCSPGAASPHRQGNHSAVFLGKLGRRAEIWGNLPKVYTYYLPAFSRGFCCSSTSFPCQASIYGVNTEVD